MIPSFDEGGNLPPGIHPATWDEIVERYATNERREQLLDGLRAAIDSLHAAGCGRVYLNGSFITDKDAPGMTSTNSSPPRRHRMSPARVRAAGTG